MSRRPILDDALQMSVVFSSFAHVDTTVEDAERMLSSLQDTYLKNQQLVFRPGHPRTTRLPGQANGGQLDVRLRESAMTMPVDDKRGDAQVPQQPYSSERGDVQQPQQPPYQNHQVGSGCVFSSPAGCSLHEPVVRCGQITSVCLSVNQGVGHCNRRTQSLVLLHAEMTY